jgi:hypothetical protein
MPAYQPFELHALFVAAFNGGDVDALMALYGPNAGRRRQVRDGLGTPPGRARDMARAAGTHDASHTRRDRVVRWADCTPWRLSSRAELSPRTFCTFRRELSSPRDHLRSSFSHTTRQPHSHAKSRLARSTSWRLCASPHRMPPTSWDHVHEFRLYVQVRSSREARSTIRRHIEPSPRRSRYWGLPLRS